MTSPAAQQKLKRQTKLKRRIEPFVYLSPTLLLLLVLMVIPVTLVIKYSFFDNVIMNEFPKFVGFHNYLVVLQDPTFQIAVKNTIWFTLGSVIG